MAFFKSSLYNILDEYAPLKSVVSQFLKHPIPWMVSELLSAIKDKNKAKLHATECY